jgi:hypothetical protein
MTRVTDSYRIPDWQYRVAEEGEQDGVLINLSPTGRVDVREGLVRRDIDRETAEETADNPIAPRKPKAAYSAVLCAYIAHHKTAAVQELLLACPRKAKEVAVVDRLMQLRPHAAMMAAAKEAEPQRVPMPCLKGRSGSSLPNLASRFRRRSRSGCSFRPEALTTWCCMRLCGV